MKRLALLLPWLLLVWGCSSSEVAGGPGSETTNGIVAVVDGAPASFASVAVRKVDFTVREYTPENAMVQADEYADESGKFSLDFKAGESFRLTIVHGGAAFSRVFTGAELDDVDTLELSPTASVSGAVTVPSGSDFVWIGVQGLDVMVKSDSLGNFAMPSLPSNDSLKLYFVSDKKHDVIATKRVKLNSYQNETVEVVVKDTAKPKEDGAHFVALIDGTPAAYAVAALREVDAKAPKAAVQMSIVEADESADAEGKFSFDLPKSGTYRLTVTQTGFAYSKVLTVKEIAELDTIELLGAASLSSRVSLMTGMFFSWVGVYGLDVLVKTDYMGNFVIPGLPAEDSLKLYVYTGLYDSLYVTETIVLDQYSMDFIPPVMVLQDFEGDMDGWYCSADSLGSKITPADASDGIEKDSKRGNVFHGKYSLTAEKGPAWALLGTMFSDKIAWNLYSLDSLVFYAKGDGDIRMAFENWDVISEAMKTSHKAASDWLALTPNWKRYVLKPSDLCVNAQEMKDCSTSWEVTKDKVRQFHIFVNGGSEFYIDDVTLYGVLF